MPEFEFQGKGIEDFRQAEWLAQRLRHEWRYDHTAEKWHHWDGKRWAPDQTDAIHHAIAKTASMALQAKNVGESEQKRLFALMQWAAQDRAMKALATFEGYGTNGDDWDAIPHLLGTKSGIVDLRSNTLIPDPTPDMLVTKTTGTKFQRVDSPAGFDDAAPEFMRVIREWMSDESDMVAFLLLWFGASLFGFTPEQRFLLMTGIGRNGKGALKHSVMKAVGEYGEQFDANMYMRTRFGSRGSADARADLIALKGKRITFFSEPEGGKFNDELLKAHTGGDRITARALHSNNVQSWDPTHSITFLVNNAPQVEDLGPSMASRVMVADFRNRYDGDREDKQLYGKLEREAPGVLGILCWAAAAWYEAWNSGKGGIQLPQRVVEQSKAFMERNDPIANWLNARAEYGGDLRCSSRVAYESYLEWHRGADGEGEAMSEVRWAAAMQQKGFTKTKTKSANVWNGFRLLGATELADRGDIDEDEEP